MLKGAPSEPTKETDMNEVQRQSQIRFPSPGCDHHVRITAFSSQSDATAKERRTLQRQSAEPLSFNRRAPGVAS